MRVAVIGVSDKPYRFSNVCVHELLNHGHEVIPYGFKDFEIKGIKIITDKRIFTDIDTISLYLSPERQPEWYDLILLTKPKRLIFNPGTFNPELEKMALQKGISVINDCTLNMLSAGIFENYS